MHVLMGTKALGREGPPTFVNFPRGITGGIRSTEMKMARGI